MYETSESQGYVDLNIFVFSHPVDGAPRPFTLSATTSDGTACMLLASFPGRFVRGREKRPGTYCWRMRLVPKISGNLDTPRIISVFPNSNPSFYVRILHKIVSAGEDNFMDYGIQCKSRL